MIGIKSLDHLRFIKSMFNILILMKIFATDLIKIILIPILS